MQLPQQVWKSCKEMYHRLSMVFKKLHKRSFLGGTAAHSLQPHPFEADSATRPSQAGFFIKDELSIAASWLIQVPSVLSCLLLVTSTPSTTLLHLTSSRPTVPQSARMVNNKSTYVSPVKPTPGLSSSQMYVIHCLEPISYRTTA